MRLISLLFALLLTTNAYAALVTTPTTYANGDSVTAINLNNNFAAPVTQLNGGLDNTNANTSGGFRFFEIKSSLPSNGTQGRVVFNTSNNSLSFDNGSTWNSVIAPAGTPSVGYIAYYNSSWQLLAPGAQYYSIVSNGVSSLPSYQQISLTQGVTGTLPIANGGTGQTTASLAINALLPSQTSNSGKFLTTNGTSASWTSIPLGIPVILKWGSIDAITFTDSGKTADVSLTPLTPTIDAPTAKYVYWTFNNASGYKNVFNQEPSYWKKSSGSSTISGTVYLWEQSGGSGGGGGRRVSCYVDIGGQVSTTLTAQSATPASKSWSVDVSSLTNATSYEIKLMCQDDVNGGNTTVGYAAKMIGFEN